MANIALEKEITDIWGGGGTQISFSGIIPTFDIISSLTVVKQETESLKCAVEILLELYHEKSTVGEDHEKTEGKLLSVLADVLPYFLGITSMNQQESWTGLLCLIFEQLLDLPDEKFKTTIPVVYVHICDILSVQITPNLKEALCKIMKRIGTYIIL